MLISYIRLKNWRNFLTAEARLGRRVFLAGPNASGKSNFLDAFRFLADISKSGGGGLQQAVTDRFGLGKIRCLAARKDPAVEIEVHFARDPEESPTFQYAVSIRQETSGKRRPYISRECAWRDGERILERPDRDDQNDRELLTQTHLEQISKNAPFREMAQFLQSVLYLHLVPQLVRHARDYPGPGLTGDPFGRNFLDRMAKTDERTRRSRLSTIEKILRNAVPKLKNLQYVIDASEGGAPHLEAIYEHWRPHGARQRETEFSDGTLRLAGLVWSLLEGDSLLLLEEPELSLNSEIVKRLPGLFHRALMHRKKQKRQIIVSTHSWELLQDRGIGAEEIILLTPGREATEVRLGSRIEAVRNLVEAGFSAGEAIMPHASPQGETRDQLELPL